MPCRAVPPALAGGVARSATRMAQLVVAAPRGGPTTSGRQAHTRAPIRCAQRGAHRPLLPDRARV
eukprot:6211790-Pleurochrysis_carterae.AAC.2